MFTGDLVNINRRRVSGDDEAGNVDVDEETNTIRQGLPLG